MRIHTAQVFPHPLYHHVRPLRSPFFWGNVWSPLSVTYSAAADRHAPCWSLRPDSSWDDSELPSTSPCPHPHPQPSALLQSKSGLSRSLHSEVCGSSHSAQRPQGPSGCCRQQASLAQLSSTHGTHITFTRSSADALKQLLQPGYVNSTARSAGVQASLQDRVFISSGWIK